MHVPFSINHFTNLSAGATLIATLSGSRHSIASEIFNEIIMRGEPENIWHTTY